MNSDKIFFPLNPKKLRIGDVINFSIYVKADIRGLTKNEYSLFCRLGEVFDPGYLAKIKLNNIHCVYYHRRDKERVNNYLGQDLTTIRGEQLIKENILDMTLVDDKEVFIPMSVNNLQPGIKVNFHILIEKENIKNVDDYDYTIFVPKGEVCQPASIDDLKQKGIDYVYFREQDEAEALQYLYHNLAIILKDDRLPPSKKTEMIYNVALTWARRFYYGKQIKTLGEMEAGFKLIDYLLAMFHQDKEYHQWVQELRQHGDKLYAHCLNTCMLGMAFTKYLGWPDNEIIEFAKGAILHDIGMIKIPQALLNKPDRLSKAEMELIKKHPQDSCHIIKKISPLSLSSMDMIFQHHEFGDGSGYLQGLKLPQIDHWALALRVIDSFEAMTSDRSWREKFSPFDALQEMRQEWSEKGTFDTNYLIEFIKFLSNK